MLMQVRSEPISCGYLFKKTCNCGGTKNEVYAKGHKELWVRPNRMDVLVKSFGKVKKTYGLKEIENAIEFAEGIH